MEDRIKKELINIVGDKNYTDQLIDLVSYSYDASEHHHRPDCGVWPETTKQIFDSAEERLKLLTPHVASLPNVTTEVFQSLAVDFAREHGCNLLLRGIRTLTDYEYEHAMALANRRLGNLETIFLPTSVEYAFLSSRLIKEAGKFGGDISHFVPQNVREAFFRKVAESEA